MSSPRLPSRGAGLPARLAVVAALGLGATAVQAQPHVLAPVTVTVGAPASVDTARIDTVEMATTDTARVDTAAQRPRSVVVRGSADGPELDGAEPPMPVVDSLQRAPRYVGRAVQQTLAANVVVNRANAWLFGADWARRVSFETWSRNLSLGWEWDEDGFEINMFGHPYQGGMYHNAGRANGLSYVESVPLALLGSWTWEYFGEDLRPSLNDLFVTTLGGIAFGEMAHRVAENVRDERARGVERYGREALALVVDPVGSLNRLVRGQWTRRGENPPGRDPAQFYYRLEVGARREWAEGEAPDAREASPTLVLDGGFGDPFQRPYRDPFDVFSMHAEFSAAGIEVVQTTGRLYQTGLPDLGLSEIGVRTRHAFVLSQRFDYLNTPAYRYGGPSAEAAVLSRIPLALGLSVRTRVGTSVLFMGAINPPEGRPPDDPADRDRDHDFGPGFGTLLNATLSLRETPVLVLRSRAEYLHSVSGTPADHRLAFADLKATWPVRGGLGVGLYLSADGRSSSYGREQGRRTGFFQSRLFVSWTNERRTRAAPAPGRTP